MSKNVEIPIPLHEAETGIRKNPQEAWDLSKDIG